MVPDVRILNLGCGMRFHPGHTNVDFIATDRSVRAHDLSRGIPFAADTFEVVYHSHLLEHFSLEAGELFVKECARVLKPGGIIRIVVPDLERIVREYLGILLEDLNQQELAIANHEWMLLELYDQTVRTRSGGKVKEFLLSPQLKNREFVLRRVGYEASGILEAPAKARPSLMQKLRNKGVWGSIGRIYQSLAVKAVSALAYLSLGGRGCRSFQEGWFRTGGEIHQAIYDYYLLERLLSKLGFKQIVRRDHLTSYVPGWSNFLLDGEPSGVAYKPDSLYAEAIKP